MRIQLSGTDPFATKAKGSAGQWQTAEATIIGNRITVVLNGVKIHDNVECTRPTGGEIDNKIGEPGPILLQGDHGTVSFRNIRIKELPKARLTGQSVKADVESPADPSPQPSPRRTGRGRGLGSRLNFHGSQVARAATDNPPSPHPTRRAAAPLQRVGRGLG